MALILSAHQDNTAVPGPWLIKTPCVRDVFHQHVWSHFRINSRKCCFASVGSWQRNIPEDTWITGLPVKLLIHQLIWFRCLFTSRQERFQSRSFHLWVRVYMLAGFGDIPEFCISKWELKRTGQTVALTEWNDEMLRRYKWGEARFMDWISDSSCTRSESSLYCEIKCVNWFKRSSGPVKNANVSSSARLWAEKVTIPSQIGLEHKGYTQSKEVRISPVSAQGLKLNTISTLTAHERVRQKVAKWFNAGSRMREKNCNIVTPQYNQCWFLERPFKDSKETVPILFVDFNLY